jgi:hypothetical protein
MIECGYAKITPRAASLLVCTLAIAAGLVATSARSAIDQIEMRAPDASQESAATNTPAAHAVQPSVNLRLAKTYKYEIPKAQRAPQSAPQSSPPTVQRSSPPTFQRAPSESGSRTINKGRYRQGNTRAKPSVGSSGSCELCRNSCYVNFRVESNSSQFVPCMRACWSQLCRR